MPELKCDTCTAQVERGCKARRHFGEDGKEYWTDKAQYPVKVMDEEVWCCPRQPIHEHPREWSRLLFLYGMYGKGHLPDKGGIVDQANNLIEYFRIMDDENADCDRIIQERETKKRNRAARSQGKR